MKHQSENTSGTSKVSAAPPGAAQAATSGSNGATVKAAKAGMRLASQDKPAKHSCKGKNDCKGQGGCKSSDNGCKGKNSCKGKGGCATDGSKMPE